MGSRLVNATVLEDRGPLGSHGDRIFRIGWVPTGSNERQEIEVSELEVVPKGLSFEALVRRLLERVGQVNEKPVPAEGWRPDFVVVTPHGRAVVEAKRFPHGAAPRQVSDLERRLLAAKEANLADEAYLVVPAFDRFLVRREPRPGVRIVRPQELAEQLGVDVAPD